MTANPSENPYCNECGSESLKAGDQKANGTEYECRDCGHKFVSKGARDE